MYSPKPSVWLATFAALTLAFVPAISDAKKPDNPGKPDGGDPYLVVELPELLYADGGFLTESVSDVSPEGIVYVVGEVSVVEENKRKRRACLWTIDTLDPDLTVVAEDLGDLLYRNWLDVNSAGIVAGLQRDDLSGDLTPVLLTPDNQVVHLPEAETSARIRINNPDPEDAIFQVVGKDRLWDVSVDGTVLETIILVDAERRHLYATDINDSQQITGFIAQNDVFVPALGEFTGDGLLITPLINPDPEFISGFADMQIDHGGNVLGDGWEEPADPDLLGVFPRAVVWKANGQVIDLGTELGTTYISGEGIASVNGTMQCVGTYLNRDLIAYVYSAGTLFELQDLDSQFFEIDHAGDINSAGMICARGKVGKRRDYQLLGCLLIPVTP